MAREFVRISEEFGIPLSWVIATGEVESTFDPEAVGGVGERGTHQVRPETFREVYPGGDIDDWRDCLRASAIRFKQGLERSGGDMKTAIAFYNAGPNQSPERALRRARLYVAKVSRGMSSPRLLALQRRRSK